MRAIEVVEVTDLMINWGEKIRVILRLLFLATGYMVVPYSVTGNKDVTSQLVKIMLSPAFDRLRL